MSERLQSRTLMLSIGGVVGEVTLVGAGPDFADEIGRRYLGFSLPNSPGVARNFSLKVLCRTETRLEATWPEGVFEPEVRSTSTHIEIRRWDFRARLGATATGGTFTGSAECLAQPWTFESLLRVIWSVLLPRAGGGLFHACGLVHGERAVLAAGPSGAGKTTLARKARAPEDVLSDEVVALHRGPDGRWRISGTPFFGELQRGQGTLQSWPLAGIAFLRQHPSLEITRVPTAEAVLRGLECLMCFETDDETVERNLALAVSLCSEVPTFICASRLDDSIEAVMSRWEPFLDRRKTLRPPSASSRELIGALRASIQRHGSYAFAPRGGSMRPWLRTGDALFVESLGDSRVVPGDVVLYWRAGRTPEHDTLICHRVLGCLTTKRGARIYTKGDALGHIEAFDDGTEAQVIGRVRAISRGGRTRPVPGRLASLVILLTSLLLMPLLRLRS